MKKFVAMFCFALTVSGVSVYAADLSDNASANVIDKNCIRLDKYENTVDKNNCYLWQKFDCPIIQKPDCSLPETTTQIEIVTEASTEATTEKVTEAPTEATTEKVTEAPTEATTEKVTEAPIETSTENNGNDNNNNSSVNTSIAEQVLSLVNKERRANGLSTLALNTKLSNVAQLKSEDMRDKNYFDHTSPTYGTPFDMIKSFGISYKYAGENIAKGQKTAEAVVTAWMNSEGHRKNILNSNFTEMGLGYATKGSTPYWTQMFISK